MDRVGTEGELKVGFSGEAAPTTVFPARFSELGFRAVVNLALPVDSEWTADFEIHSHSFTLGLKVSWCKRVYERLWEVGFDYLTEADSVLAAEYQDEIALPEPDIEQDPIPVSLEQGGLRLEEISHEELSRLAVLAKICEVFNSSTNTPDILQKAMEILLDSTGAQRCLLLIDRGHETMEIPAACGPASVIHRRYSRTVVDEVKRTGRPVISKDVDGDSRFRDAESLKSLGVRSILCVPVKTEDREFGLIYLDNAVKAGVFTEKELQLSVVIAGLAASALARAEVFSQMIQGEKMAVLGTMLTGTIHELNNPLTAILCLSEMIHQEGDELTESLMSEARRCRNMVNQLLQTARTESHTQADYISLEEVVEHAIRIIRPELELYAIELVYEEPDSISEIKGNSDRLAQILLNLLFNALYELKAKEGGLLEVRLYERQDKVCLVIADNGRGVAKEQQGKIFDPFFTTKPAGEGTGMGLAVTHRLVKEHGGDIAFENRAEGGAMFTITFPAVKIGSLVDAPEAAG